MRVSFNPACIFAALLGATVGTHAADLGVRYPVAPVAPAAVYVPIYNWTGFYLGITGHKFEPQLTQQ